MTKLITLLTLAFFLTIKTNGQNIDSLKLTDKENTGKLFLGQQ